MKFREVYTSILNGMVSRSFNFWQKVGIHVTPNHFYEPIPDTRTLKNEIWKNNSLLPGIKINEKKQIELLATFSNNYRKEYEKFPKEQTTCPYEYYLNNDKFESVDSEILYCMIRHFKPSLIYEIGSGNSTYVSAKALLKNINGNEVKQAAELITIEPYPNETLKKGFPGCTKLIEKKVQEVPITDFQKLRNNDILFIDSSHVLKIGSDVQYEYLEILPRLNKGVIIHVHDIFLPAEYRKEWIFKNHRFWTEQYLLQAFLAFNDSFEILWAGSYMHLTNPEEIEKAIPSYNRNKNWPGSFWMKKIK